MSRPDVRVRRTRALLRGALVELIEVRGFDRITVGELAERAMISRAAFYRNYRDKYELVEQIFDEAMAELADVEGDTRTPDRRWADFLEHVDEYHQLYRALLGGKGSPWFAGRMRDAVAGRVVVHLPGQTSEDLVPRVVASMFLDSIVWWLEHDRPCPPARIAEESVRLIRVVLEAAAKANPAGAPPFGSVPGGGLPRPVE